MPTLKSKPSKPKTKKTRVTLRHENGLAISPLELEFLTQIRLVNLPEPVFQFKLASHPKSPFDFAWQKLIVEITQKCVII